MKVRFITFGCSRNQADTELMKGLCKHEIVEKNQDVTVINSCFVKYETEKKIIKLMHSLKGRVVLAGCLAQARPQLIEAFPQHSFIGVKALMRINEAIENQVIDVAEGKPDFCQQRILFNSLISIVPISDGCLGVCTYCCTRQARGKLKSRSIEDIIKQVKQDLDSGVKELWLTSQDNGCYGFDINSSLPRLLDELTSLKGDFRIRVGMMNPQHALKILPSLKKSFQNNKLYKFLHVPVQSGSDKILRDMNRGYTVKEFLKVIKAFPGFNISTDVICGYPTETNADWNQTISLINDLKPGVLNISRFHARPGTPSQELKQLPSWVSKERSRAITKIFERICLENNKKMIGSKTRVLVNEPGIGRDEYYRMVNIKARQGSFIDSKVTGAGTYFLKAKVFN